MKPYLVVSQSDHWWYNIKLIKYRERGLRENLAQTNMQILWSCTQIPLLHCHADQTIPNSVAHWEEIVDTSLLTTYKFTDCIRNCRIKQ